MGPIILFDKSALQSFSIDESVWLDNFFLTNITPLFYIETLADLSLQGAQRSPITIISEMAAKTPPGSMPNTLHSRLLFGNLMGQPVEVGHGRPILDQGATKKTLDGKIGVHYGESEEAKALHRWHQGSYSEIEKDIASNWRKSLELLNFDTIIGIVKNLIPPTIKLNDISSVKRFVDHLLENQTSQELLTLLLDLQGINQNGKELVIDRWAQEGKLPLPVFAPYANFVFGIDLFFYISIYRGFIAKERPSNRVDIAYLYYLPFCQVFTSGDKLHAKVAPLFLGSYQTFIKASQLKEGLAVIDTHYVQFMKEIDEVGLMKFTAYPPIEIDSSVHGLWDIHCPNWRHSAQMHVDAIYKNDSILIKHLNEVSEKSTVVDSSILDNLDEVDHVIISRMVPVKRGKWRILPKGIENEDKSNK